MTDETTVRLIVRGLIQPGFQAALPTTGTVTSDGVVEVDEIDMTLSLPSDTGLSQGTEVRVFLQGGQLHAQTVDQVNREAYERKAQAHLRAREKRQRRQAKRERAAAFWAQYELPFDYDVAIKGRRSGLGRGSWSNGHASNTVEHLYVCEAFTDGRLSRDSNTYLCTPSETPTFEFAGERRLDETGDEYIPPVTCQTCLSRMARWKQETATDSTHTGEVVDE